MKTVFLLLALLIGLFIALVAMFNNEVVTVNYLFGQVNLTLFMLILSSAFAGALFAGFLGIFRSIHNYMHSQGDRVYKKELERRVKLLESQKGKLETELGKHQKERELAAEKAFNDLENEKKKLEEELKKQQQEREDVS